MCIVSSIMIAKMMQKFEQWIMDGFKSTFGQVGLLHINFMLIFANGCIWLESSNIALDMAN
jgi:hypothetical protein